MNKVAIIVISAMILSGCSFFTGRSKPIETIAVPVERSRLELPLPDPLRVDPISWVVITPDNAHEVWETLKKQNSHQVLFAISSNDYEKLSLIMSKIRSHISSQRLIIIKYQEYYEPNLDE